MCYQKELAVSPLCESSFWVSTNLAGVDILEHGDHIVVGEA